jgi:hypothetical protein
MFLFVLAVTRVVSMLIGSLSLFVCLFVCLFVAVAIPTLGSVLVRRCPVPNRVAIWKGWDVGMKCTSEGGGTALKISRKHWNKLIFNGGLQAGVTHFVLFCFHTIAPSSMVACR